MRVVDEDGERLALVDGLEAAGDPLGVAKRGDGVGAARCRGATATPTAQSAFSTLKRPGSGSVASSSAPKPTHAKRDPDASKVRSMARRSARSVAGGRERDRVELGRKLVAVGVVDVDHRALGPVAREQAALGEEVVLHVAMEVEVVLGEVREGADGEADPVDPVQAQRVRGDLHRAGAVAAVDHPAEGLLQLDRLRRRALDLLVHTAHDPLDGAQQPGLDALALEDVADQEGGRGLAVGAGDPGDAQLGGGIAVEADRGVRHRRAGIADLDLDHVRVELERTLDDDGRGTGLDRVAARTRGRRR